MLSYSLELYRQSDIKVHRNPPLWGSPSASIGRLSSGKNGQSPNLLPAIDEIKLGRPLLNLINMLLGELVRIATEIPCNPSSYHHCPA